jgi:hypothetical protein
MKKIIILALGLAVCSVASARYVQFSSGFPAVGTYSDGSLWTSDMTFQVGGFDGAAPTSLQDFISDTNWIAMPAMTAGANATNWDETFSFFFGDFSYSSNPAPFTVGSQAYIFGFNSLDAGPDAQWILLSDASWTIPASAPDNPTAVEFMVGPNSFIVAGIGSLQNVDATNIFQSAQAIPEPSTYALIFGLGILGFLGYRRFRK